MTNRRGARPEHQNQPPPHTHTHKHTPKDLGIWDEGGGDFIILSRSPPSYNFMFTPAPRLPNSERGAIFPSDQNCLKFNSADWDFWFILYIYLNYKYSKILPLKCVRTTLLILPVQKRGGECSIDQLFCFKIFYNVLYHQTNTTILIWKCEFCYF